MAAARIRTGVRINDLSICCPDGRAINPYKPTGKARVKPDVEVPATGFNVARPDALTKLPNLTNPGFKPGVDGEIERLKGDDRTKGQKWASYL